MVDFVKNRLVLALAALVVIVHKVHGQTTEEPFIMCYQCNNAVDSMCGNSFDYTDNKGPAVKCVGKNAACKKIITKDSYKLEEMVSRSCYDESTLPEKFFECQDVMKVGEVCHCNTDYCNGQGHLLASGLFVTIATVFAIVQRLF